MSRSYTSTTITVNVQTDVCPMYVFLIGMTPLPTLTASNSMLGNKSELLSKSEDQLTKIFAVCAKDENQSDKFFLIN